MRRLSSLDLWLAIIILLWEEDHFGIHVGKVKVIVCQGGKRLYCPRVN